MIVDYLVVGSGLTGATIARVLADAGREVLVLERRSHIGGNVHDSVHPSGIRIHTYGPHYFRTSSERIWRFVTRFGAFARFAPVVMTQVDGTLQHWPVTSEYIRSLIGDAWQPAFDGTPSNFEEASLALMPQAVYDRFVRGYSEKQWGVSPTLLSPELARRFEVRACGDRQLTRHRWQGIPVNGYSEFMEAMLEDIPVLLNCDYSHTRGDVRFRKNLIYTGAIDEFFAYDLGRLSYRAQLREHQYIPDCGFVQPVVQLNNPSLDEGPHIRTIEWKHLLPPETAALLRGSVITREIPFTPVSSDQNEYPFPDPENRALYEAYRQRMGADAQTVIAGRLGEYRYLDMDQAIARAMHICRMRLGVRITPYLA